MTPPQTRISPAVRFDRRGVIVRFDLEGEICFVVKPNNAGVVLENADQPIVVAPPPPQFVGRGENRLAEHVLEGHFAFRPLVGDPPC